MSIQKKKESLFIDRSSCNENTSTDIYGFEPHQELEAASCLTKTFLHDSECPRGISLSDSPSEG